MPNKGLFQVELIEASTKQPFKEHSGINGMDSYVEVEPGIDYFIKVKNNSDKLTFWDCKIDGVMLNYSQGLKSNKAEEIGIWTFDTHTNQDIMRSLGFHKSFVDPRTMKEEDRDKQNELCVIEVYVYGASLLSGTYKMDDHHHNFTSNPKVNAKIAKKHIKSGIGKFQVKKSYSGVVQNSKRGKKLQTFKIKYCSTVGLIIDGVLPKPPLWDWFKMVKPQAIIPTPTEGIPEPTSTICNETKDENGNIIETKFYEMFDLTNDQKPNKKRRNE